MYRVHPRSKGDRILVICGPGNNGGDGLVAARHLWHYGYKPVVHYPKQSNKDLYRRLKGQLESLNIPFTDTVDVNSADHIVDAIFGFSFSGEVRDPFPKVIQALENAKVGVTSVDIPSSWDVEKGPPASGLGSKFQPQALVSLTAPKPCVQYFKGRHFVGGRFVPPGIVEKYNIELPEYQGVDQIAEVPTSKL